VRDGQRDRQTTATRYSIKSAAAAVESSTSLVLSAAAVIVRDKFYNNAIVDVTLRPRTAFSRRWVSLAIRRGIKFVLQSV